MAKLTADTITDEQIRGLARCRDLHRSSLMRCTIIGVATGNGATYTLNGMAMTQREARARCAEIINTRAASKEQA